MAESPVTGEWPLTGRAEELSLIKALFDGEPDRSAGVAIIGPAGVGKSRLASEAATAAADAGAMVRWTVATDSARTIPLGAFSEWTAGVSGSPLQLVGAVIDSLTEAPAGRRVVVAVDDAHLLDELSSFVLHQLVLRGTASVIISIRSGESVPDAVTALWKDRHVRLLELQPLSVKECEILLQSALDGLVDPDCVERIWALTRGNVLYLRHLVDQEFGAGRLTSRGGRWVWTGRPVVSASLIGLIESQVGSVPDAVLEVVDLVAVSEPLETSILASLVPNVALEDAERRGLISMTCTRSRGVARISHPLYGEVRRHQAGPWRLRRLRGMVAKALADIVDPEIDDVVRVGVLWGESDLPPDPQLFLRGAQAAFMRLDLDLAERLADASVRAGGGPDAAIMRAHVLNLLNRAEDGEQLLKSLDTAGFGDAQFSSMMMVRAANFQWQLSRPQESWDLIETALRGSSSAVRAALQAFRGVQLAMAARPSEAVAVALPLDRGALPDLPALMAVWGLVIALGDVGRTREAAAIATEGFDRANRSREAPYQGLGLAEFHVSALLLAGCVGDAVGAAANTYRHCADAPGISCAMATAIAGMAAMGSGRLDVARRQLVSAGAVFEAYGDLSVVCYRFTIVTAEVLARLGEVDAATQMIRDMERRRHPSFGFVESDRLLATAWLAAARGTVTPAIASAQQAADYAYAHGQLTREVLCLQTATQFGDKHTAARLLELEGLVEGPRAAAAAAFAVSLAAGDGDALQAASDQFEAMGDVFASADASAHASVAYRGHGQRGAALTAAARAQRISEECGGAVSPALCECVQPDPFTVRERDIISLVTQGFSNRQIAEELSMSIRTVEGHLYRASGRSGASNRGELSALFRDFERVRTSRIRGE